MYLVTGAGGFIGGHIYRSLSAKWSSGVIGTSRTPKPNLITCDLTDAAAVANLFSNFNIDAVIHCAGNPNVRPDTENQFEIHKTNTLATHHLLHNFVGSRNPRLFVYMSSVTVYKEAYNLWEDQTPLEPASVYGCTKLASEHLVNYYDKACSGGLGVYPQPQFIVLRPCTVVGKGNTHGVFTDIVRKLKSDAGRLELWGSSPGTTKPFLHVSSLVDVVFRVLTGGCGGSPTTLNVAGNYNVSVRDLAFMVMDKLKIHKKLDFNNKPTWVGDFKHFIVNCQRAEKVLGWVQPHSVDEIVKALEEIV